MRRNTLTRLSLAALAAFAASPAFAQAHKPAVAAKKEVASAPAPQGPRQVIGKMLELAHASPASQWPEQKKQLLDSLKTEMRSNGNAPSDDVYKALADVGETLEKARALPAHRFKSEEPQLSRTMLQAIHLGLGIKAADGGGIGPGGSGPGSGLGPGPKAGGENKAPK